LLIENSGAKLDKIADTQKVGQNMLEMKQKSIEEEQNHVK
jgi:hypothetical protein